MNQYHYDCIVAGGGPAGCMAAIAAARQGAKTLLVERQGSLGGALTNMGVAPMMTFHAWGTQPVRGLGDELVKRLVNEGASTGHISDACGYVETVTPFDVEMLRVILDEMTNEAGVEVLFHTHVSGLIKEGTNIKRLETIHKGGKTVFGGKVFIDCTGDADIAFLAGCPVQTGRERDGLCQPMTKCFQLGNVDTAKIRECISRTPENFRLPGDGPEAVGKICRLAICGFYSELERARTNGDFTFNREHVLFFEMNEPGFVNVNISRVQGKNFSDPYSMSSAEREGRQQMMEIFRFFKKYVPGFDKCVLIPASDWIGIRETRRIIGDYVVSAEDLLKETVFEDAIAASGYPIDIHSPEGSENTDIKIRKGAVYTVPYRALIAKGIDNLLVCGRALSATHEAAGALRVTPTCMATGEASGTAAAVALGYGCDVRRVPYGELSGALKKNDVFIGFAK